MTFINSERLLICFSLADNTLTEKNKQKNLCTVNKDVYLCTQNTHTHIQALRQNMPTVYSSMHLKKKKKV